MRPLTHPSPNHSARQTEPVAVCLHWTGGAFAGSLDWCMRRASKVSYHELVDRDGTVALLVPPDRAAWAVGRSLAPPPWQMHQYRTSGNSLTYNIALAGSPPQAPTAAQIMTVVGRCVAAFVHFGWPLTDRHRITGHIDWAMPRGRKVDPVGDARAPWLDLDAIRTAVGAHP